MANPGPSITSTSNLTQENVPRDDGHQIGSSADAYISFYGADVVQQPEPQGNVATVAAGSVTAAYVNTTFSGGVGTTGYSVGDIVAALKALGLLKE